jgi:hypothetical protein
MSGNGLAGDAVGGGGRHVQNSLCGLWGCLRLAIGVGHRDDSVAVAKGFWACPGLPPLARARGVIAIMCL